MSEPAIPPLQASPNQNQVRTWNMLCHLSVLSGLLIPFGSIIGPLLVWQIKKHEFPSVEVHGKAALNFQLTVLIAALAAAIAAFVLSFFCIGFILIPVVIGIALCGIIFPIIAGVKANEGVEYKYPYTLNLVI